MLVEYFQLMAHPSLCTQEKSEPLEEENKEIMYVFLALLLLWTLLTMLSSSSVPSAKQIRKM